MAKIEAISLPSIPDTWTSENNFKPLGKLSVATQRNIEPIGAHFLSEARRKRHKRTFSEDERILAQEKVKKIETEDDGEISEPEDPLMLERDAKDWKGQDHYAVLGITKYRYKATPEQIKRANRKKVLKHHPDKRAATGGTEDDAFFKCIQKATEILLDPVRRRQFDSVDAEADVEPPSKKETKSGDFYKLWGPVFESEARFSKTEPTPRLGNAETSQEDVENFYDFWLKHFDSWRTFEYLDEDVPDDSADRDQRRHIERKNVNQRKKKKTEDTTRLRNLVETALSLDPRIVKFRKEASAKKNAKKNEREAEEKRRREEDAKRKEEDDRLRKEAEETEKAQRAESKKAKEAAKNAVKKNKRVVRGAVKDANYLTEGEPSPSHIDAVLNDVDALLAKVEADEVQALTSNLNLSKDAVTTKATFKKEVDRLIAAGKVESGQLKSLAE